MTLCIGIDIGGTKIAAGVVDEEGSMVASARRPTPSDGAHGIVRVSSELVAELRRSYEVAAVGVGAAGFIDADRAKVVFAPNLTWRNEPLKARLESTTGLPTVIENDANAAAWAEARFGAARGARHCVVLTVGTGVGGGVIVDGKLLRGAGGMAGELGHINVKKGGRRCGCGRFGCLERYGSGRSLVHEARELAMYAPDRAERLLELAGGTPEGITGMHITQAAKEGDEAAIECFDIVGDWLGIGMADLSSAFDPAVFVLAGGVSEAGELLRKPAAAGLASRVSGLPYRSIPPVLLATLGNDAGIIGAADLARTP
ncbi:MAG: ROK family glucokinase [Dermatophilus congolensis]|nr:ROK family glucokinase [Dermatophilus congolensis]